MAALGAIGRQEINHYRLTNRTWTDATKVIRSAVPDSAGFAYGASTSTLSGVTKKNSTGVPRTVRVYRRDNGALLASVRSDSSGNFVAHLNGFTGYVFIMEFDDLSDTPNKNAIVYDLVVPA